MERSWRNEGDRPRTRSNFGERVAILGGLEVVQRSPFDVRTLVWEASPDRFSLTLCIKATYRLVHGGEAAIIESVPIASEDERWGDAPEASLRCAAELVPYKPRADLLLVGHAHAPGGREVPQLVVRWRVGEFEKAVRVSGDRTWVRREGELEVSEPTPFSTLPLRYERAVRTEDNPVGLDLGKPPAEAAPALPNLEPLEGAITAAFGPLSPSWRSRRRLLGEAQLAWATALLTRDRPGPAPAGFDFSYFNAAPTEQQVDLLRANSAIILENMHPAQPLLATRLPAQRPKAHRIDAAGRFREIPLRCDTLYIDADSLTATLCFRGLSDLESAPESAGHVVVDLESARGTELPAGSSPPGAPHPLAMRHDAVRSPRGKTSPATSLTGKTPLGVEEEDETTLSRTHELPPGKLAAKPLPFGVKRLPPPPPPKEAPVSPDSPDTTEAELTEQGQPLPFRDRPPKTSLARTPPPAREPVLPPSGETMEIDVDRVEQALLAATPFEGNRAAALSLAESADDEPAEDEPGAAGATAPTEPPPAAPALAAEETGTEAPTPEIGATLSVARCARILAELRYGASPEEVLREENIQESTWKAALAHWQRALREELDRGECALNDKFDRSYVTLFEAMRRPLEPADYATLVVETERAAGARAAEALGIDPADLGRVLRAVAARLVESPEELSLARAEIDRRRRET